MANYNFLTVWLLDAPIDRVWDAIVDYQQLPTWWKAVDHITSIAPGDANGLDSVWQITWKTPLSYTISFESRTTYIEPPHRLDLRAIGEVEGTGRWELSTTDEGTLVKYYWTVKTTKAWMNFLALLIRPLMEWNHNAVMQEGAHSLANYLGVRLLKAEAIDLLHTPQA